MGYPYDVPSIPYCFGFRACSGTPMCRGGSGGRSAPRLGHLRHPLLTRELRGRAPAHGRLDRIVRGHEGRAPSGVAHRLSARVSHQRVGAANAVAHGYGLGFLGEPRLPVSLRAVDHDAGEESDDCDDESHAF